MRVLSVNPNTVLVELADLAQTLRLLSVVNDPCAPAGVREIIPGARTLLIGFDPRQVSRDALIAELSRRLLAGSHCDAIPQAVANAEATPQPAADPGSMQQPAANAESMPQSAATPGPMQLATANAEALLQAALPAMCVEIPVHYDGEDLAEVAALLEISPQEVIERHTGCEWAVAFTGFAPGFAYLSPVDAQASGAALTVPRRATPRSRIPAGAVALAGGFSAVYPKATPGGWQLIGHTLVPMWALDRDPPALLRPGQRVRFVDAGPRRASAPAAKSTAPVAVVPLSSPSLPAIEIRTPGVQALLQDLGRPGQSALGVGKSGAMDRVSLQVANALVGNPVASACIEIALGGFALVSRGQTVVAVTGGEGPINLIEADGRQRPAPREVALTLTDGTGLSLGPLTAGMRSYLAVRGGFDREPVLGSRSYDTLAAIGPAPLRKGEVLALGNLPAVPRTASDSAAAKRAYRRTWPKPRELVQLDVTLGPRTDWFSAATLQSFLSQEWTVTPQSNRIGLRLEGAQPLACSVSRELPREGVVFGAIQIPASGQPVVFMADHPLTGGYPVIACIAPWHLDVAAQLPIRAKVQFRCALGFETLEIELSAAQARLEGAQAGLEGAQVRSAGAQVTSEAAQAQPSQRRKARR